MDFVLWLLFAAQSILAARVVWRMWSTARASSTIAQGSPARPARVSVIVPVLDEAGRVGPCLNSLIAQDACVIEILVVDGGSSDATDAVVAAVAAKDGRVRLLSAPPVPPGWNGKAWNLETGLAASSPSAEFVVTIDADVRAAPALVESLVAHARSSGVRAFSVATRQELAGPLDALLHPSMLTTLVYRFGIPGSAHARVAAVQANGQCFFAERTLLCSSRAIEAARDSRCEDVTIARALAAKGIAVGFYEAGDLVRVEMYAGWSETLRGWPRSLPLVDRLAPVAAWIGILEVALVQAVPPWIALALVAIAMPGAAARALLELQIALVTVRVATLFGTRRAYAAAPWSYWLSPATDVLVSALIVLSALRRRHRWRGRTLVREASL